MVAHAEQAGLVEGLRLERVLGRGAHSVVWSAQSVDDSMPWRGTRALVVKLALDSSVRNTGLLRREARVLARLRNPAIVRLWQAGTADDGRAYLVLSASSRGTLEERLRQGPLSVLETLAVARSIAQALDEVHRLGLVHRDVKPSNVLLDHGEQAAWLSDFGLSADSATLGFGARAENVAGSFHYSAPEQTGMLRREVDGRADLYALGGVMFECLAGRPAFQGDEIEALLRLHATARPPDVRRFRAETPEPLAQVLAKLLAKDPDDRYPTAKSLLADLECIARDEPLVELATQHCDRELLALPLVGRDTPLRELRRSLSGLARGEGGVSWLLGAERSGRARVCRAALAGQGLETLWVEAGADETNPFAVFRSALSMMTQRARSQPAREHVLRAALEREGPALARLFPELGLAAREGELSFEEGIEALVNTFVAVATPELPLVLVIERADRLGAQERGVLLRLRNEARRAGLLLVCTAEHNPFAESVAPWRELTLEPLTRAEVAVVLAHLLGPLPFDGRLPELALQCSAGIPGRLVSRVALALREGALDTDGSRFVLDEAKFLALEDPLDSAHLAAATAQLTPDERLLLSAAALTGARFDPEWLVLMGFEESLVNRTLWEATQLRILAAADRKTLSFVRRDLATLLVDELPREQRVTRLARLARGLESREHRSPVERALLSRALYESADQSRAQHAWEHCLESGLAAHDAFAFAEARALLNLADELARRFALETDFRLPRALGQLEAQAGHTEAAITHFKAAIDACPDALERASLHVRCAEIRFYNEVGHTAPMREHIVQGFAEMGLEMVQPSRLALLYALFWAFVARAIEITGIGRGSQGVSLRTRTRMRLLELSGMYYFFIQRIFTTVRTVMHGWAIGRMSGPSRELGYGLCGLGNFFYITGLRRRAERYFVEAHRTAEQLADRGLYAYARYMQATGLMLSREVQRGERIMMQTLEQQAGYLDISYLGQGAANLMTCFQLRGYVTRAAEILRLVREQTQARMGAALVPEACTVGMLELHIHQGRPDAALEAVAQLKKRLSSPEQDPLGWITRWHYLAVYEYARGSDDATIDAAVAQARRSRIGARGAIWLQARGFYVTAHVQYLQWLRAQPAHKPARAKVLFEGIRAATRAPDHPLITGYLHLLRAIEQFVRGRGERAEKWLALADREARRNDLPALSMETHALRAQLLNEQGRDEAASREARCAIAIGQSLGQLRRVREIEQSLSLSSSSPTSYERSGSLNSATSHFHAAQRERDVLVEVAMAASLEIEPVAQARVVLDRLIGLLGAERGMIFADGERGELVRLAARSAKREDLDEQVVYAQSLVRRVRDTGVPLVLSGTEEGAGLGSQSMVAASLRSMVCAPVRLGSEVRGVIYLDSSLARGVFTRKDLEILAALGSQIAVSQEVARSARVEIERHALDKDLQLSGTVQALFLPQEPDDRLGSVQLSAAYTPVSHAGGDFWNHEKLDDGRLWVFLADATGHGAGAAMVTAVLAGSLRSLIDGGERELGPVLTALGSTLSQLCAGRHAVTMTALEISADQEHVRVFSAGGPPLLVRTAEGKVEPCALRGTPLGATPFHFGECELPLSSGTRVLMVTDGILEMPTVEGRELGLRRLRKLFTTHAALDVPAARDALMREVSAARGSLRMEDDLTLLLLGRN